MYSPEQLELRDDVKECSLKVQEMLAGYYAHVSALDNYAGEF
ncbi:hypothetical protein [Radiobacillus sp. PE A8.2]